MIPGHDLIALVAILTIFIGAPSMVFYWIIRMKREARASEGSALALNELEDRIQRAVERANEPLRLQIASLEDRVAALDEQKALLPSAGSSKALIEGHEPHSS